MTKEGHVFNTSGNMPRLSPLGLFEKMWLTAKHLLFVASEKDKERLGH